MKRSDPICVISTLDSFFNRDSWSEREGGHGRILRAWSTRRAIGRNATEQGGLVRRLGKYERLGLKGVKF